MLAVSGASIWNGKSERPFTGRHFVDLFESSQPSSAVYHRDRGATLSSALGRISSENITIGVVLECYCTMRSARILRWVGRKLVWMMHDEYIRRIADCSEQQETVII